MNECKTLIYSISTLAGTIIGVGIFSLPYITLQVGFPIILIYFLGLGILVILIHQFFGELSLKTPDLKRLPGFARYHLGELGEKIAFLSSIFGTFGAILAYLIVGGEFTKEIFSPIFGGSNLFWTLIYFSFGAILIFFGIKAIATIEFLGLVGFFLILIGIFLLAKNLINVNNLFLINYQWPLSKSYLFFPYGPILFSLWGAALIPEVEEMLREQKYLLKHVIFISILIPIFVYLFFIYLILGICGAKTTESALIGLKDFLDKKIVFLALIFGLLTTFTSFISLGLTLKKILWYDLKLDKNLAWIIACFCPLIFFLMGVNKFIPVISFIGSVMLGLDGILILLMYRKINRQNLLIYPLFLIFLFGIFYELFYFFKIK